MFHIVFLTFFALSTTSAELVLSEIDPSSEFIEVYNNCESCIVSQFIWSELTGNGIEKKYVKSSVEIPAGDFFVFEMSRKINNTGDIISLYDENENLLERVVVPLLQSGKTYQKNFLTEEWFWGIPTKGIMNIVTPPVLSPPPPAVSLNIIISEILPNPEGIDGDDNEFIELYNSESFPVNISGFTLQDLSGKKYIFPDNTFLESGEYKAFYKKDTKITLNNTRESIYLYNKRNIQVSKLEFNISAPSGKSYISENSFTETVTENAKNILYNTVTPISSGNASFKTLKIHENFTLFPLKNRNVFAQLKINQSDLDLVISKVSVYGKPDFIEVFCKNCNAQTAQLSGVMLSVDGVVYQIPNIDFVKNIRTGDTLRFEFYKNTEANKLKYVMHKNGKISVFPVFGKSSSGLVSSDEVIAFGGINGEILDLMCYANMSANGRLISSEKKDLGFALLHNAWKGELKEWGCVNSSTLTKNTIFIRKQNAGIFVDTNTKNDFVRVRRDVNEEENKKQFEKIESIKISRVELSSQKIEIEIKNISKIPVLLNDWYIANHQTFFIDIKNDNNNGDENSEFLLYPNQFLTISIKSSAKKYAKENLFLSIRNASGKISDAFCINKAKDKKGLKKAIFTSSEWNRKNVWKKESGKFLCFEYRNLKETHEYIRKATEEISNFSTIDSYNKNIFETPDTLKILNFLDEDNSEKIDETKHVENLCITIKEESFGLRIFGNISACKFQEKSTIDFSKINKIRIYIPKIKSKNAKFETKVIKEKYEFFIEKPFKKGRYAIDIRLFSNDTKFIVAREKINLINGVLQLERGNIEISKVLPNPTGRDKNNEKIVLKNSQSFPHWSRNWTLNGKILPSFFVEKNEVFVLPKMYYSGLKNKNAQLVLKDSWGNIVSVVNWKKARNNEWFGIDAEKYVKKNKAKKSKKRVSKKSKKYKRKKQKKKKIQKLQFNKKEQFSGVIEKIIYVTDKNNSDIIVKKLAYIKFNKKNRENNILKKIHPKIRNKNYIFYEIPFYLLGSEQHFSVGSNINIFVKSGKVVNAQIVKNEEIFEYKGGGSAPE
ncbi:TPA: lamin tail domain-containing protein, partial [Candidatus Gracilibacteria bacterium]|nr:lamin tail domain-containing protein [Candidatus Gracilibacteria bacterium]